jgi:hypothetical protein
VSAARAKVYRVQLPDLVVHCDAVEAADGPLVVLQGARMESTVLAPDQNDRQGIELYAEVLGDVETTMVVAAMKVERPPWYDTTSADDARTRRRGRRGQAPSEPRQPVPPKSSTGE